VKFNEIVKESKKFTGNFIIYFIYEFDKFQQNIESNSTIKIYVGLNGFVGEFIMVTLPSKGP
jgi:hypothetical protein